MPEVDIEAEAAKKRRQAILKAENEKRGKRMFGLMRGTLEQAKKETGKLSGVTKNRQEVEERLHATLHRERAALEEKRQRERETKELRLDVIKKEEEIANAESIVRPSRVRRACVSVGRASSQLTHSTTQYRTRNSAKLNLASFLCTTFTLPPPPPASDGITVPYDPRLPHVLRVTNPTAPKPLYYLPRRLLPFQEDLIEDQIASVKKHIRIERDAWEDRKGDKISDLAAAKRKRDAGLEEIERAEREERQKRRREDEEHEERVKSKAKLDGPGAMEVDGGNGPSATSNGGDKANGVRHVGRDARGTDDQDADVAMGTADSGARPGSKGASGDATPAVGGKMDVEGGGGETGADELETEELEY